MITPIRPFVPLHEAIEDVLRCAADFVVAVHERSIEDTDRAYFALDYAVEAHTRAKAAHHASVGWCDVPRLAVLCGGLPS